MDERDLTRAREALEAKDFNRALRTVWKGGFAAIRENDEHLLEGAIEIALVARDRGSGRVHRDAEIAVKYFSRRLADLREGVTPVPLLARLVAPVGKAVTKTCPDCAESVRAEARVCRFCGCSFGD